ncbi:MAG: hypothetical protein ACREGJ_01285 [Candidatus Saccharimonadales bacterium]
MHKEMWDKFKKQNPKKRALATGAVLVIAVLVVLLIAQTVAPGRSVASYCQTYKEEKARLAKLPGDTWPSGVFNDEISDAGEFAASFRKLEKVAPEEIRADVATLGALYQKIHDDPSQAIGASLSGASADESIKKWTKDHCTE